MNAGLQLIETLQQDGQKRQKLLIQKIMIAATDTPEQGPKQQEVVVRLLGFERILERLIDKRVQMRFEHFLVLGRKHRHWAKHELKKLQVQVGPKT